jgi:HEPN domain
MRMPNIPILSPKDFEELMVEIDRELDILMDDCRGRELRGWMLFCQKLKLEGMPLSHPVSESVIQWFKTRYGDRLNLDFSFGRSALVLRNNIFRFRCAVFYGRAILICAPELINTEPPQLTVRQPACVNVLRQFENLTQDYALSLGPDEQNALLETYVEAEMALAHICDATTETYIHEARGDLTASVDQLVMQPPQFGASKWSSLQGVEKFLKSFIVQKGSAHKSTHDLVALANQAEHLGLRPIGRQFLKAVQCAASVRYDTKQVTKGEALDARSAALSLCAEIANQFPVRPSWTTKRAGKVEVRFRDSPKPYFGVLLTRNKS